MKKVNIALLTVIAITLTLSFTLSPQIQAQSVCAEVSYIKVTPGHWMDFMQIQEMTMELHQARVDEGIITGFTVYRNMFPNGKHDYDFVFVTGYDDYKKSQNPWPQEMIDELYTKEEQADYRENMPKVMSWVGTEMYDNVTRTETWKDTKYLRIGWMQVDEPWAFSKQRKEIIKPMFDEVVSRGHHTGWSLWERESGSTKNKFIFVNGFAEHGDWKQEDIDWEGIFTKVHPDKDFKATRDEVMATRSTVYTEYWEVVMETE